MAALQKPKLFETRRSLFLAMGLLLLLFAARLLVQYHSYTTLISKPFYYTYVDVITAYSKQSGRRSYQVLKVYSDEGWRFYTTTHRKEDLSHTRLRLQIFPDASITFVDYLGNFYLKSRIKEVTPVADDTKTVLSKYVKNQHTNPEMSTFYRAIFFAMPLSMELRKKISKLGVSHLVALSGFHLTILWGLLYGVLWLFYRLLQQRYFPYRYALMDVGGVVILLLGAYVWFVGAPPSLIRSYAMVLLGWGMLLLGLRLLSFEFLFVVFALLLALFPSLSVSLSFWLSVAGVFYIFLLLHYTQKLHKYWISFAVLPFGIFVLMLPIVHSLFGTTTECQLLSPLLSLLFVPFYPLVMLLHLVGQGDLLDPVLQGLFALECPAHESLLSWWAVAGYVGLSLAATRYRWAFYGLLGAALSYAIYLFVL